VRVFLAIELPDTVREHLVRVQAVVNDVAPKAVLVGALNLHLTLKFLGEIDERKLSDLSESLEKIHRPGPVMLQAQDVECFPSRGPIHIVGGAIGGDLTPLLAVHKAVEQRCKYLGFEAEARGFRPHVTLARAKAGLSPGTREQLVTRAMPLWPGPTFTATSFTLFQSILRPSGAEYRAVRTLPIDK
jgi:2'-5' RNA ligase